MDVDTSPYPTKTPQGINHATAGCEAPKAQTVGEALDARIRYLNVELTKLWVLRDRVPSQALGMYVDTFHDLSNVCWGLSK